MFAKVVPHEFHSPIVCNVFLLTEFRLDCRVNVMTDLMEKHASEAGGPEYRHPRITRNTRGYLVYVQLDPSRLALARGMIQALESVP